MSSIVLDKDNIRGSCFRSKTSHKGQPFGCKTAGSLSHGSFSWLIKWLQIVDEIWENSGLSDIESIFLQWTQDGLHVLSYGETIQLLRHYLLTPWRSQASPLANCTINFALHSMKTIFLAWTAQRSDVFTEEQRMVQGHHKSQKASSLRRYSRDDVYPQLQLQATLISIVQAEWRPALAQHRGAQAPMVEPAVQLEKFHKDHEPLVWKRSSFNEILQLFPVGILRWWKQIIKKNLMTNQNHPPTLILLHLVPRQKFGIALNVGSFRMILAAVRKCLWAGQLTSSMQFALIHLSVPGAPTFEGIARRSMCGARLNPHMQFSDHPKPGLSFCRKPACMKAWSMMESG